MLRFLSTIAGRYVALFLALAALWLLLSGFYTKPTLLLMGVVSIAVSAWLSFRAGMADGEGVPTRIFPGIIGYMLWLTIEIGKANFQVLGHALKPKLTISPKMVKIPADQTSDLAKVIFANSITLTPGTVSVDLHEDCVIVHGLTEDLAAPDGMIEMGRKVCAFDGPEGKARARLARSDAASGAISNAAGPAEEVAR